MITSLFRKSTPLNYSLVVILLLFCFFMYQFHDTNLANTLTLKAAILAVLLGLLFVVNFIVKKNGLTKNSSYTILFYLLSLLFFPSIFSCLDYFEWYYFCLLLYQIDQISLLCDVFIKIQTILLKLSLFSKILQKN